MNVQQFLGKNMSKTNVVAERAVNDNSEVTHKTRRLTFNFDEEKNVAAHLKLEDTEGRNPIRIPISRKLKTVQKEAIPDEWGTILTPARFVRKLGIDIQPHHQRDAELNFTRLEHGSRLYIYVNGYLWRELEVGRYRSSTYFQDVNIEYYENASKQEKDNRIATGQRVNRVVLPVKLENKEVTVEVAYSHVQWSWARVESLGGIAPEGMKRVDWFPDEHSVNTKGKDLRADRMQVIPLLESYGNAFSETIGDMMPIEKCNFYEFRIDDGKKIPFFALRDPIDDARDLAFTYQQSWRDLENYIAEISDIHNKDKHPFSPWFESAVLANQYFFVEHPEFEAKNVDGTVNKPKNNDIQKAKKQIKKWRSKLSLEDIQTCLGMKKRKQLRDEIENRKNYLTKYLDKNTSNLKYFIAALDDYLTRPACKGDTHEEHEDYNAAYAYKISEEILARIGDHKYTVDIWLETNPPKESELNELKKNDLGRILLADIADFNSGHPLTKRLFPAQVSGGDSLDISKTLVEDDPTFQSNRYANLGRRSVQWLSGFTQHFYQLGIADLNKPHFKSIVGMISESGIGMRLDLKSVKIGDIIDGVLTDKNLIDQGYFLMKAVVISADNKLKRMEAANYDSGGLEINNKAYAPIEIYKRNKLIGTTSMEAMKNGRALSSRQWRKKRHNTDWLETKVKIYLGKRLKGIKSIAHWAVDSGAWAKGILPVVGFFEFVNLKIAYQSYLKSKGTVDFDISRHQFLSAMLDTAAIVGNIYDARGKSINTEIINKSKKIRTNVSGKYTTGFIKILGAGASAYSAFVTHKEIVADIEQGDDAAIAKSVMEAGFILVAVAEVTGLAVAVTSSSTAIGSGAMGGLIGFMGGPMVWIGLAVILIGAILLTWVFTEDTPLEEWLAAGPFTKQPLPKRVNGSAPEHQHYVLKLGTTEIRIGMDDIVIDVVELGGRQSVYADDRGIIYKTENGQDRIVGVIGGKLNRNDFPEHSPRFARFNPKTDPVTSKFHIWRLNPSSAARALHSALMTPSAQIRVDGKFSRNRLKMMGADSYEAIVNIHIPNYIDNKTLVFIELWSMPYRTAKREDWKQIDKDIKIITGEGSGPRDVAIIAKSESSRVRAEIYIDLYGDGKVIMPINENKWTEQMEQLRQQNPDGIITEYYDGSLNVAPILVEDFYDDSQHIPAAL